MDISKLTPAGQLNMKNNKDGKPVEEKFLKMIQNPIQVNEKLLLKILDDNKNTEYGKKYGFADIKSLKDFQEKVPISEFKDYEPYIKRMSENNEKNLITAYEVDYFCKSSGTTGKPKKIPMSLKHQESILKYNSLYMASLVTKNIGTSWVDGKCFSLIEVDYFIFLFIFLLWGDFY